MVEKNLKPVHRESADDAQVGVHPVVEYFLFECQSFASDSNDWLDFDCSSRVILDREPAGRRMVVHLNAILAVVH